MQRREKDAYNEDIPARKLAVNACVGTSKMAEIVIAEKAGKEQKPGMRRGVKNAG